MESSFKISSIDQICSAYPGNVTAESLEIYSKVKYDISKSGCIVSVERDGFFY